MRPPCFSIAHFSSRRALLQMLAAESRGALPRSSHVFNFNRSTSRTHRLTSLKTEIQVDNLLVEGTWSHVQFRSKTKSSQINLITVHIVYLLTCDFKSLSVPQVIQSRIIGYRLIMNWIGHIRYRSWPNFGAIPAVAWMNLRKLQKSVMIARLGADI